MTLLNKTFLPAQNYNNRKWFLIDCKEQNLGRLSTIITTLLKGKIKPYYHPSIDLGDHVILINADSIIINQTSKHYLVYNPGRPGHSLKIKQATECLPKVTIEQAVKKMLSKTERKRLMRRLNIYNNENHPHNSQKPIKVNLTNLYLDR